MNYYVVVLGDIQDSIERRVVCKGEKCLTNFLLHVDKSKYLLLNIETIYNVAEEQTEFLKKEKGLETGENNNANE